MLEPQAQNEIKARTGGKKGRHLPVTTVCQEASRGQNPLRVKMESKRDDKKSRMQALM